MGLGIWDQGVCRVPRAEFEEWYDLGDWIQPGTSWYPIAANESEAYGGIENYDSAFTSAMRGTP